MADLTSEITPSSATRALRAIFDIKEPVFIWGPPGIGKSDIIHQLGKEMNAPVIDVRLSLWEPTDIKGIPYYDAGSQSMVWAAPQELPTAEFASKHPAVILFLDEMNSAAPSVLAAAYQLVLNRRVGQYHLPDNVLIVAAGNNETDGGVTHKMPKPLSNRFTHLKMRHDFDDWAVWATNNGIHSDVLGFLYYSKGKLYDDGKDKSSKAFPTPRSWSKVSKILGSKASDEDIHNLVAGTIGEGLAIEFRAHREVSGRLPNPEDVLSGAVKTLEINTISAMYSLAIALCYELKECSTKGDPDFEKKAEHFFTYIDDNFQKEITILCARLAIRQYNIMFPAKNPVFSAFLKKHSKLIRAATIGVTD